MLFETVLLKMHDEIDERMTGVEKRVLAGNCKTLEDYKAECLRIGEMKWMEEKLAEAINRMTRGEGNDNNLPEMKD